MNADTVHLHPETTLHELKGVLQLLGVCELRVITGRYYTTATIRWANGEFTAATGENIANTISNALNCAFRDSKREHNEHDTEVPAPFPIDNDPDSECDV